MECKAYFNAAAYLKTFLDSITKQTDNAGNNIASKDINGYVKTDVNLTVANIGGINTGVLASNPTQSVDENLVNSVRESSSRYSKFKTLNDYSVQIESFFGLRGEQSTFHHFGLEMIDAIRKASFNPDHTNRTGAVHSIDKHLKSLNHMADKIQDIRASLDNDIKNNVNKINALLKDIAKYNLDLAKTHEGSPQKLSLVNGQRVALQELSEFMNIKIRPFGDSQIKVLSESNFTLVQGEIATDIGYESSTVVDANTNFQPITLDGLGGGANVVSDFSKPERNGTFPALVYMRDVLLKGMQEQLDNYAFVLKENFNTIHNLGTAINPPNTLISYAGILGNPNPLTNLTDIAGNGTIRVGTFDPSTSKVVSYSDIDLSTVNNMGDLISTLNGINGITANVNGAGRLQITSNNLNYGLSISNINGGSAKINSGNPYNPVVAKDFSNFFGFNNLIETKGVLPGQKIGGLANTISIRADILGANGNSLAAAPLSDSGVLPSFSLNANDDIGYRDTNIFSQLVKMYNFDVVNFDSSSTSSAVATTLQKYSEGILGRHVKILQENEASMKSEKIVYEGLSKAAFSISGVDPEETLQQIYDLALSKRMGLNAMGVLKQMNNDVATLLTK